MSNDVLIQYTMSLIIEDMSENDKNALKIVRDGFFVETGEVEALESRNLRLSPLVNQPGKSHRHKHSYKCKYIFR